MFCHLSPAALAEYDAIGTVIKLPLFREDDTGDRVFVLCSGHVKLSCASREGRTINVKIASQGEVLGLSAVVSGSCFEVSAETLEPTFAKVVRRVDFLAFLVHHSGASLHVSKLLAEEYKSAFSEARRMALSSSASGKLASLLLDWGRVAARGKSEMRLCVGKISERKTDHDQGQFDPHSFAREIGSADGLEIGAIWRLAGLLAAATLGLIVSRRLLATERHDATVIRVTSETAMTTYAAINIVNTKSDKEKHMSTAIATNPIPTKNILSLSSPAEVFSQMEAIEEELSRAAFALFERRGYNPGSALEDWLGAEASLLEPVPVSIDDKDNQFTVKAEVPGFSPDQLKVSIDGNMLSICGKDEQSQKETKTGAESAQTSTSTRRIHCKVTLPSNVDSKRASATLDKGVLMLILPKLNTSTKIEVKAA